MSVSGMAVEAFLGKGFGTEGVPNTTIVNTPPPTGNLVQPDYTIKNTGRSLDGATAFGINNQRANH